MTLAETLQAFQTRYGLTTSQANTQMSWPRGWWSKIARGAMPPPDNMETKLNALAKKYDAVLLAKIKRCPHCRQNVAKWVASGGTHCPYCAKIFRQSKKVKIRVHLKRKVVTGEDLDRIALAELGYTVDYKKTRKRRS